MLLDIVDSELNSYYFGKLPSHGDFVRHLPEGNLVNVFDLPLQKSLLALKEKYKDDWLEHYKKLPDTYFMTRVNEKNYAGIIVSSFDSSGRAYPFILFSALPDKIFGQEPYLAPLVLGSVWKKHAQLCKSLLNEPEKGLDEIALYDTYMLSVYQKKVLYEQFVMRYTRNQFSQMLGKSDRSLDDYALECQNYMIRNESRASLCMRLPLIKRQDLKYLTASFWGHLINKFSRLDEYSIFLPVGQSSFTFSSLSFVNHFHQLIADEPLNIGHALDLTSDADFKQSEVNVSLSDWLHQMEINQWII